jgi:DAK2 domain fusion protein YloV
VPAAQPMPSVACLDATGFLRWAALVRSSYAARRAEIDSLNVFPVHDGDTGTNLYLTLDVALDQARQALEQRVRPPARATLGQLCAEMAQAMLLTARGNSGVILSQLFGGISEHVLATGVEQLDGPGLAQALVVADQHAWRAVTDPKEGTILSVSRAAAQAGAAAVAADPQVPLTGLLQVVTEAAEAALERTPAQLAVLARAGVVDAGGAGYLLFLEGLYRVVHGAPYRPEQLLGRRPAWTMTPTGRPEPGDFLEGPAGHAGAPREVSEAHPQAGPGAGSVPAGAPADDSQMGLPEGLEGGAPGSGAAYEVQFLLSDTDEVRVQALGARLGELGDSLLIVGGAGTWNVHVHAADAGAALEAGIAAGRPHRITVAHLPAPGRADPTRPVPCRYEPDRPALAVVAGAGGDGIAEVLRGAGATIVPTGPGRRASTGHLLEAIRATGAAAVLVLPNDPDTELVAQAAAGSAAAEGRDVRVVRACRTAVQGLAALAVFDTGASVETNLRAMTEAATATRHGAVTVARKEALTAAGWCRVGDVLGAVDDELVVIGADLSDVATEVTERLLAGGGELLTVISGDDAPADLAPAVAAGARRRHPELDVTTLTGAQPLYPLLLGVE